MFSNRPRPTRTRSDWPKIPFRLREMIECRGETPVYAAIGGGYCLRNSLAIRVTSESMDFEAMCVNRCVKHGE
nr:hypothetical protein [Tanacetum cinerariifolium]